MALLDVRNLSVSFDTAAGQFFAVQGVDLSVDVGEVLAIVGESGSGKSVAMLAVMGLLPPVAKVTADVMRFEGKDLLALTPAPAPRPLGQRDGDDLPGAGGEPQPLLHRRLPDRGDAARAHRPRRRGPPRPGDRAADRRSASPSPRSG